MKRRSTPGIIKSIRGDIKKREKKFKIGFNLLTKNAKLRKGEIKLAENLKLARDIIYEVLGEEPAIKPVGNKFCFIRKNGVPCELKISQKEKAQHLEIEASLYDFIQKETGLPVPTPLGKGKWGTVIYLLYSSFGGISLQEYLKENPNNEDVLFSTGRFLGILHSIEIRDRGLLKPDLSIQEKRLFPRDNYINILQSLHKQDLLPENLFKKLSRVDIDFFFLKQPNVLSHGSFVPQNLLIKEDRVEGIMGWEKSRSAPPFEDLSSFSLHLDTSDIFPTPFYEGYSRIKPLPSIYLEHEEFYKFYGLLCSINQKPTEEWKNLKEEISLLSSYLEKIDNWPVARENSSL